MRRMAESKGLKFRCDCPAGGLMVRTDPVFVKEIVRNLADNAIKFTKSGEVTVEFSKNSLPEFYIRVRDTGIGIKKEDLNLIFEEFRQASEGFSRAYEGVGLGLTLVKKMVDTLGGRLKVESEPGIGSVFTVVLPCEGEEKDV